VPLTRSIRAISYCFVLSGVAAAACGDASDQEGAPKLEPDGSAATRGGGGSSGSGGSSVDGASGTAGDTDGGPDASAGSGGSAGSVGAGGGSAGSSGTTAGSAGTSSAGCGDASGPGLEGIVTDSAAQPAPLVAARVTLTAASAVYEVRTDVNGRFAFAAIPAGAYSLGASKRDYAYVERAITLGAGCSRETLALGPETHRGSWQTLGNPGEALGGTNSGVLLPDGRLMYCHDTLDPVILDPVTNRKAFPPQSPRLQGCHAVTVMPNGLLAYVGGHDQPVYGPGTRQVKTFNPQNQAWQVRADLNDYRWYPSMVPLPNGELLAVGGGNQNNPQRTNSSEVMDPATMTWRPVGNISIGNEVSPIVLLYTGEVLMTHRPPQLYDPGTEQWRAAGSFVQTPRMPNGDHADHEVVLLSDGRVVAVGYKTFTSGAWGNLVEIYDPATNRWQLGQNYAPVRSRASIVLLPDERVLVLGGYKEQTTDPTPVNQWGYMALSDLYDPARNAWRRLENLSIAREYHATPILVPDGRVIVVGGEGEPGNEPPGSTVEAFSPPYLFRGPRPEIAELQASTLTRGGTVRFKVTKTSGPTRILLVGTTARTHFMDSGNGRFLELQFTQQGDTITANIPATPARAVFGYYMLFAMVDDIPSVGRIVRIAP
jgi:hypothetical protein